jgi:TetR/AcrR family transcriptional repressor of nem operon
VDETFRIKLRTILESWVNGFAEALAAGKARGQVRGDVDVRAVAAFVIATFEGAVGMTKNTREADYLRMTAQQIEQYLETLRP